MDKVKLVSEEENRRLWALCEAHQMDTPKWLREWKKGGKRR